MVVTSSGREVPMAIIVAPIIASGTPRSCARAVPLSMRSCAPSTMAAAPIRNLQMLPATAALSVRGASAPSSPPSVPISRFAEMRLSAMNSTKNTRISTLSGTESCPSRVKAHSTAMEARSMHALAAN